MAHTEHDQRPTGTNPSDTIVHLDDSAVLSESRSEKGTDDAKTETQGQVEEDKNKKVKDLDALRNRLRPIMLYVVSTAQFLDIVNGASVSVALLPIAEDLKFSVSLMPWILNAYTITFAGLLLFSGRMGDLYGHRRIFLFGLFWFATWALVVSFSRSPVMFVVSRALQGMGAACTVPSAMALIAINYPAGPERTKAFSIFGAFGGMGAVVGILMAGGLIASIGWSWIFRVSAIVAIILLIVGFMAIQVVPKRQNAKVDYLGSITTILGVIGVVYYITMGTEDGWASPKTLPVLIVGLVLLAAFVWIETKVEHPIMPFRIWKSRLFTSSVIIAFFSMGMMQGVIYYGNLIFQQVYGWDSIQTALGFLVHALLAIVVLSILGRTLPRMRLKPLILFGFLLRCASALMFAFVTKDTSYWRLPFPALIVHVFGIGFSFLPVQITAVRDADNSDQGLVGAIYNTGLQLGGPFGIAILNAITVSTNGPTEHGGSVRGGPELMKGYKNSLFGIVAFGLVAFVVTAIMLPWDKPVVSTKKKDTASEDALETGGAKEELDSDADKERMEREIVLAKVESLTLDADLAGIPPVLQKDEDERTIASRAGESRT
ncbi:major facilitator superfamily domain-containing protein [Mortierella sp. GBAus27b]|nr:hypothetical protein BGX31_010239 [Mortierella sp. GBA43]KAI8354798.1 major facilitator superfamily domain-containing protein [Mortierella sp. GBAus27b]